MNTLFAHGIPEEMALDTGAPGDEPIRLHLGATCTMIRALIQRSTPGEATEIILRTPVPILVTEGPTHVLRIANQAWRQVTGYRGPTGVTLRDAFPWLTGQALMTRIDQAYQRAEDLELSEIPIGRTVGRTQLGASATRFYSAMVQPIRDAGAGAIAGLVVVGADLTAQVLSRQLLTDVMQTIIWSGAGTGPPGRFNRSWFDYTGLSADDTRASGWHGVAHPDDLAACRQAFDEAMQYRIATQVEGRLRRADGQYRWHRIRFTFIDSRGDVVRWFGIASDIDDVRCAQEERAQLLSREQAARAEAESANRQKDQFLATLSHELRAPLSALLLWAKVMQDDPPDAQLRRRALAAIRECTLAQSRLVDDLLDISRAINGKLHLALGLVPIEGVLRAALDGARPAATDKGITLRAGFEPGLGEVRGDVGRLLQVLQNLLSNAIKFTETAGLVSVEARRNREASGDRVEIQVHDTGIGITPELLPRLFDAFSQGEDSPLSRAHGGLGLGLTIARQLVGLHGGSLSAYSEGRGRGATFTVSLPLAGEAAAPGPEAPGESNLGRLRGVRVLLVDDDPLVLEPLGLILAQEGASVECADSADAAWTVFTQRAPDVLLSDIAMPGPNGDGYSLLRRVRSQAPLASRGVPAVALTAYARDVDRERALTAGFSVHLAKPVDVEKLVTAIEALVAAKRPSPTGRNRRASGDDRSPN